MTGYTVLFRDPPTGRLLCRQSLTDCADDRAALRALKRLQGVCDLELWDRTRLIAVRGTRGRSMRGRRSVAAAAGAELAA